MAVARRGPRPPPRRPRGTDDERLQDPESLQTGSRIPPGTAAMWTLQTGVRADLGAPVDRKWNSADEQLQGS